MFNCSLQLRLKAIKIISVAKDPSFSEIIIKIQQIIEFMQPSLFELTGELGS